MKTTTKINNDDKIDSMKTRAVIYCRVSSKEQEETGYSLPAQEKFLREYAQKLENDFEIIKTFQVSESAGGKMIRKIFTQMMEYISKNNIPVVIVETTDRLTRNFRDVPIIDSWIMADDSHQIHLSKESCILHRNSKSHEWFMWRVKVATAEYYVKLLSENVKKGQAEKIRQGWLPTRPPVGYRTVGEHGHKTHVIDENMAPIIKRAFELYATGNYSMKRLADELYKDGFRTKLGKKPAKSRIEDILKEPFYYGAIRWNDVLHNNGAHKPIISKELFDKVTEVRTRGDTPKYQRHQFTFRKLLKCKECDGTITAEIQKGIIYYHCTHYKGCTQNKYTPEKQIEEKLLGVFKFFENITPAEAERIKDKIKANHAVEIEYKESTIKSLNERYSHLQSWIDQLYNDRLDKKISPEFWDRKQKEINDEQAVIRDQLAQLKSEETKYFEIWLNILDLARRAREIYQKRSPEQRRTLIKYIFQTLMLKDGETEPTLKPTIEKIAKRVQQKLDAEKIFEPTQITAESIASSGDLRSYELDSSLGLSEAQNNFRTSKKSPVKPRHRQITPISRPLLPQHNSIINIFSDIGYMQNMYNQLLFIKAMERNEVR